MTRFDKIKWICYWNRQKQTSRSKKNAESICIADTRLDKTATVKHDLINNKTQPDKSSFSSKSLY